MLTLPDPNYWYCLCVWVCVVPLRPTLEHFTGTPEPPPAGGSDEKIFAPWPGLAAAHRMPPHRLTDHPDHP